MWAQWVAAIGKLDDSVLRFVAGRIMSRWWHEHRKQFCKLTCQEVLATQKTKGQSLDYDKVLRQRLAACRGSDLIRFMVGLVTVSDLPRPFSTRDADDLVRFSKLAGVNPKTVEKAVVRELSGPSPANPPRPSHAQRQPKGNKKC